MRRIRTRLWAALLSVCLLLSLLPVQVLAADEMYSVTLHYDEALCTVTANRLFAGDDGMSDPSKTTMIVTGDGQSAQTPKGTWLEFQIDNIAEGYRIGSVTVNGTDRTEGFINGAYGGMAFSNISRDYELTAVMEPVPDPLPSVTGVTLYMDENGTILAPESITYTSANVDDRLYGKATFSDGAEHPTYYAMGQWQFSTDGKNWNDTYTWGDNRFDFWPGWEYHEELDFLHASYDLRLKVTPWDIYTTGDPVYSNVIHVNGGAGTGGSASLAVDSVSFGTSGPQHTLNWSFPDGVTEADLANCHLKLELYDADAQQWVLWDNGVSPRLNGGYILEDLLHDSDRPRGHFTKIRVSTVANSDSAVLGSYEGAIDLTVNETQAPDLSAKAVFTKESDGRYTVETSGLTVGQVYCVVTDYIDENQEHTQVLATAGGVSATAATMTAENIPVVGDRESLMADASYRVLQFETSMPTSTQLSMTITDRSGWKPVNEPAASVPKATKVYFTDCRNPGYNGCSDLQIVFDGKLTALERYDVYLYHPDTDTWRWFAAAAGTSGTTGYIMEPHALNRNLDGHYTKVRVVSHPVDDSLGDAVYEQDIDLTVTNQTSEDAGCSVVYTRTGETETDALYTVNVTGLPAGDYYRIETYSDPSFDSTKLTDVLGHIVASNSNAELSAKVKLDNDPLMKDAYYLARSVDSTQDGNTTCTVTITNLTGWKQCFPPCQHNWGEWTETPATCTQNGSRTRTCSLCNEVETVPLPALGHDYQAVVTAPTCTEQGYSTHTCSRCHDSHVDSYVDALGHDWSTNDCTQQATCSRCDAVRPAGTHVWGDWTVDKAATCTEEGSRSHICTSCGASEREAIAALGHAYQSKVTAPTCTEKGYTTHTCSRCNDRYVDSYVDALGHAWGDWVLTTPPTEEHTGTETRTCSRCNATETRDVANLERQNVLFPASSIIKTYGDPEVYNTATNLTPGGGTLTYASADPAVAVVDAASGKITIKGVGTATITATAAAVPNKYVETSASFTLTVNRASLTIRADDATIVYGQSAPHFSWSAQGFVYQEDESVLTGQAQFVCDYKTYGAVGTYPITLSGLAAQNYDVTFEAGTLTVSKAEGYTITLGKLEQLAGHTSPVTATVSPYDATAQISIEYLVNGSWTKTVPAEAGTYAVRAALTNSDNISFAPGSYTEGVLLVKRGVTVDTGSGTADVDVSVEVDSGKAEISVSEDDLNTILENSDGNVSVDLGGVANVDELVLPGDLVSELSKNDKTDSLTVSTEDASVTLSGPALDTVAGKITSDQDKVTATLKSVNKSDLNEAQQAALKSIPEDAKVVDVSLAVTHPDGSQDILHELGGDVTITVPYDELPGVIEGQYVVACHVSDNGVVTYLFAICDPETRTITFTSNHFSNYAVFVSANPAVFVTDGSGSGLYEAGATVAIKADSKSGYRFDHWEIISGNVTLADAASAETTFVMPSENVELKAVYTKVSTGGTGGIGGGSSTPTYGITVETAQNGSVSAEPQKAAAGDTVTLTVKPDEGYQLDQLTVTDGSGKAVSVKVADGKYTFVMPGSQVTVQAVFVKSETAFTDVPAGAYYAQAVEWAVAQGITAGTSTTTFSPEASCTRAQVVTFLWRAAGSPAANQDGMDFTDVAEGAYYAEAVRWAVSNGITTGTGAATFSPDAACTRAQIAVFLYRANGSKAPDTQANPFDDVGEGSYYYDCVLWAVENGITAGTSAATFSPDAVCTRAQIVTFLFRAMGK